jgi:hypothetical protein
MPATGNFVLDKGYRAAGAITKFRAVKFSANETVTPVSNHRSDRRCRTVQRVRC